MDGVSEPPRRPRLGLRRTLAVSGAKGGAGKSILSANLALYLASIGRRVVLVDADIMGSNAHTFLGVDRPAPPPFRADQPHRSVRAIEIPIPGLRLLSAGFDLPAGQEPRAVRRSQLLRDLSGLEADYVVVDLGGAAAGTALTTYLAAESSVFVTLPEPTAIERTHAFFKTAFCQFALQRLRDRADRARLRRAIRRLGGNPSPLDLIASLGDDNDPLRDIVDTARTVFAPRVVLNQTRLRADIELADEIRSAIARRLGIFIEYLGHVDFDDTVWSCVRARRPLLVESPGTKASRCIEKIARRIVALDSGKAVGRVRSAVPHGSHHDLLEVERGATEEEVRRAYKRAKELYADDSLACYGLFSREELAGLRVRLEEAYDVLLDPARRRPYELSVFPEATLPGSAPSPLVESPENRPAAPDITPDTEFTGPLLRMVRESQGLELREISARTKIGTAYLRAVEEDDFTALPPLVYVRGFVAEIAKVLKLDPAHASRTYARRYRRYLDEQVKSEA